MIDMLLAGDRAVVRVPDTFGKDYHCEVYQICNDNRGKLWDKIGRHGSRPGRAADIVPALRRRTGPLPA